MNADRQDANPNLLWRDVDRTLHVIDHNLAFGDDAPDQFWRYHIFRGDRAALAGLRAQNIATMNAMIEQLPGLWEQVPDLWRDSCLLRPDQVDTILRRCLDDGFWAER